MTTEGVVRTPEGGARDTARRHDPAPVELPPSGVYVLESHHSPVFRMPIGRWPFIKICWVPVGRGRLETEGTGVPIAQDDLLIVPPDFHHRFVDDPEEPLTLVIVCVDPPIFSSRPAWRSLSRELISDAGPLRPRKARNRFHQAAIRAAFRQMVRVQSQANAGWEVELDGLLAQLLVALCRGSTCGGAAAGEGDTVMEELVEYLESHFVEPQTLADLAARCGVSPRRFTDRFRAATGTTLIEYLNRKRIDYARERLRETGHIAYACHEAGFQDLAYFYRTFKRYTGMTPGRYATKGKGTFTGSSVR